MHSKARYTQFLKVAVRLESKHFAAIQGIINRIPSLCPSAETAFNRVRKLQLPDLLCGHVNQSHSWETMFTVVFEINLSLSRNFDFQFQILYPMLDAKNITLFIFLFIFLKIITECIQFFSFFKF